MPNHQAHAREGRSGAKHSTDHHTTTTTKREQQQQQQQH